MMLLARDADARLTNQELSDELGASSHHLAKVMRRLVTVGLVDSTRGPTGGFTLKPSAEAVKLIDIYEAIEGPIADFQCLLGEPNCEGRACALGKVVHDAQSHIVQYLRSTNLQMLAEGTPSLVSLGR